MVDRDAVSRAIAVLRHHPHIAADTISVQSTTDDTIDVLANVQPSLPVKLKNKGHGAHGVRSDEPVLFRFTSAYPEKAPVITLREDFPRSLPHIQPRKNELRPEPCLVDGSIDELFQAKGLSGVLDQLAIWLTLAANDELVSEAGGWEPTRRYHEGSLLSFDSAAIRALVEEQRNLTFLPMRYMGFTGDKAEWFSGELAPERVAVQSKEQASAYFSTSDTSPTHGTGLGIVCPPGAGQVNGDYNVDTVSNFADLKTQAHALGCGESFDRAVRVLSRHALPTQTATRLIAMVLTARRPYNLRRANSNLEVLCYFLRIDRHGFHGNVLALAASQRELPSPTLLARVSNVVYEQASSYSVLGCGSLGSKLTVHLARAGLTPVQVVDSAHWSPHNVARHALLPFGGFEFSNKARLLASQLRASLHCVVDDIDTDAVELLKRPASPLTPVDVVVNATASLRVRNALAGSGVLATGRVIETSLYDNGNLGVLAAEGANRNPSTLDLVAEMYTMATSDASLRVALRQSKHTTVNIGVGCSTATMPMSDARLSMFASTMAESLLRLLGQRALPDAGTLQVLTINEQGITSSTTRVPAVQVVTPENAPDWRVHVSDECHQGIERECQGESNEQGGVLLGLVSETAKRIIVSRKLLAPTDSTRTPTRFTLGTKDRDKTIASACEAAANGLRWVGTWHSHPHAGGPSATDRETCRYLATQTEGHVAVLLIWTPGRYLALLADPASL